MGRPPGKTFDARLPGAWVPRDLLDRALADAGPGQFGAWIRCAMEEKLRGKSAHKNSQKREAKCAL